MAPENLPLLQKESFFVSSHIIPLPVSGSCTSFSPGFHITSVNIHSFGWAFIKSGKISSKHDEICTHGQRQGNMIIMDNTAIRTNWNIDTCFFVILISGLCNFNQGCCLSTSDSLLFSCDTDRTTANSNFYKICTSLCQETETSPSTTFPAPTLTLSP